MYVDFEWGGFFICNYVWDFFMGREEGVCWILRFGYIFIFFFISNIMYVLE